MKKILYTIAAILAASTAFSQGVYSIAQEEVCWTVGGVDSSLYRYSIVSYLDDPQILCYINAQGDTVTVSGGTINFGICGSIPDPTAIDSNGMFGIENQLGDWAVTGYYLPSTHSGYIREKGAFKLVDSTLNQYDNEVLFEVVGSAGLSSPPYVAMGSGVQVPRIEVEGDTTEAGGTIQLGYGNDTYNLPVERPDSVGLSPGTYIIGVDEDGNKSGAEGWLPISLSNNWYLSPYGTDSTAQQGSQIESAFSFPYVANKIIQDTSTAYVFADNYIIENGPNSNFPVSTSSADSNALNRFGVSNFFFEPGGSVYMKEISSLNSTLYTFGDNYAAGLAYVNVYAPQTDFTIESNASFAVARNENSSMLIEANNIRHEAANSTGYGGATFNFAGDISVKANTFEWGSSQGILNIPDSGVIADSTKASFEIKEWVAIPQPNNSTRDNRVAIWYYGPRTNNILTAHDIQIAIDRVNLDSTYNKTSNFKYANFLTIARISKGFADSKLNLFVKDYRFVPDTVIGYAYERSDIILGNIGGSTPAFWRGGTINISIENAKSTTPAFLNAYMDVDSSAIFINLGNVEAKRPIRLRRLDLGNNSKMVVNCTNCKATTNEPIYLESQCQFDATSSLVFKGNYYAIADSTNVIYLNGDPIYLQDCYLYNDGLAPLIDASTPTIVYHCGTNVTADDVGANITLVNICPSADANGLFDAANEGDTLRVSNVFSTERLNNEMAGAGNQGFLYAEPGFTGYYTYSWNPSLDLMSTFLVSGANSDQLRLNRTEYVDPSANYYSSVLDIYSDQVNMFWGYEGDADSTHIDMFVESTDQKTGIKLRSVDTSGVIFYTQNGVNPIQSYEFPRSLPTSGQVLGDSDGDNVLEWISASAIATGNGLFDVTNNADSIRVSQVYSTGNLDWDLTGTTLEIDNNGTDRARFSQDQSYIRTDSNFVGVFHSGAIELVSILAAENTGRITMGKYPGITNSHDFPIMQPNQYGESAGTYVRVVDEQGDLAGNNGWIQAAQKPGWALYADNAFTSGSPLSISAGDTITLPCNALLSEIETYLPPGVDSLWNSADSTIIGQVLGDSYTVTVDFKSANGTANGEATVGFDVSGTAVPNWIASNEISFPKGTATTHTFSLTNAVYALSDFISNGAKIRVASNAGTTTIWDIQITVRRDYTP